MNSKSIVRILIAAAVSVSFLALPPIASAQGRGGGGHGGGGGARSGGGAHSGPTVGHAVPRPSGGGPGHGGHGGPYYGPGRYYGTNHYYGSGRYYGYGHYSPYVVGYAPYYPYYYPYRPGITIGFYAGFGYPYGYVGGYYGYPAGYGYPYGYGSPAYGYSLPPAGYVSAQPGASYGGVRLQGAPLDAQVFVDGYYVGVVDDFDGPTQHMNLQSGAHRLEVRPGNQEPLTLEVNVLAGRTMTYHAGIVQ
jgi:hypothetical protein